MKVLDSYQNVNKKEVLSKVDKKILDKKVLRFLESSVPRRDHKRAPFRSSYDQVLKTFSF
jgi:hypothetical protein